MMLGVRGAMITKEEEKAAQKLFANGSYTPSTLSAIGVGVLALVMMLGVRIRRGFSPARLDDNLLEMESQSTSSKYVAARGLLRRAKNNRTGIDSFECLR